MGSVRGNDNLRCAALGTCTSDCEVVMELFLEILEMLLRRVSESAIDVR